MSVLDDIVAGVREDLAERQARLSEADLLDAVQRAARPRATRCRPSARPASR